jgi:diadenosine tetraphosphate (Ap4A) HIT family hydrolase
MQELGRLLVLLDEGFGTGIMQKYQPLQTENGIKVNHLHFHIFPREEIEDNLFPTPMPNSFQGFRDPKPAEIKEMVDRLRKPAPLPDCNPI